MLCGKKHDKKRSRNSPDMSSKMFKQANNSYWLSAPVSIPNRFSALDNSKLTEEENTLIDSLLLTIQNRRKKKIQTIQLLLKIEILSHRQY